MIKRRSPAEKAVLIGQLDLGLDKPVSAGHGCCSTEYVRGREALEARIVSKAFIAKRNQSFILQGRSSEWPIQGS